MTTILKATHIKKKYGRTNILDDITLNIESGEFVVIMGSSGAGKTTLLNCVSGMDSPDSGEVTLINEPLSGINDKKISEIRSNKMGFVFQDFRLLDDMSLLDNLLIRGYLSQNKEQALNQANTLLEATNLVKQKNNYPSQLSGGQKQRGAIARALMNNPKIIFADEPTGALNSSSSIQVLNTLTDINQKMNTTILMVTHDMRAAIHGDKVIYLSDGQILGNLNFDANEDETKRNQNLEEFLNKMGW